MSFLRVKHRKTNENVYLQNRSAVFLTPPMRTGDLIVERNESVGNDLTIGGNLTVGNSLHARNYYASGNFFLNNYVLIPAGTIIQSAAFAEPDGWLDCNGRSLSIYDYAGLFAAIQYTYGGSGVNFTIPDMRGRVGVGNLGPYALGATGGAATHALSVGEMPSHTHTSNATGGNIGLAFKDGNGTPGSIDNSGGELNITASIPSLSINNTGDGAAHNNMQPYVVLRYLIKY